MLIMGLLFLVRGKALYRDMFRLSDDKNFVFTTGYLALILGLVTVLLHNVWELSWQGLVTLFGWISLIKGVSRIGWPESTAKLLASLEANQSLIMSLLVALVVVSGWLVWTTLPT